MTNIFNFIDRSIEDDQKQAKEIAKEFQEESEALVRKYKGKIKDINVCILLLQAVLCLN